MSTAPAPGLSVGCIALRRPLAPHDQFYLSLPPKRPQTGIQLQLGSDRAEAGGPAARECSTPASPCAAWTGPILPACFFWAMCRCGGDKSRKPASRQRAKKLASHDHEVFSKGIGAEPYRAPNSNRFYMRIPREFVCLLGPGKHERDATHSGILKT